LIIACEQKGIEVFIVAFDGQTDPAILKGRPHIVTRLGAAGRIINTLKSHAIRDIVMIGSIRRLTFAELRPDMRALGIVMRNGLRARGVGDDGLLRVLRQEFERDGLRFHGVQSFVADLLAEAGILGRHKPDKNDMAQITRGIKVVRALGALDVGQAAILQEGIVLGVEGAEGTDEMIRRCAAYRHKGRGAVLVKLSKPQQDTALDLPTIGPDTVNLCAHAGMAGIVVEAGRSLILDPQDVVALADKNGLFIMALSAAEVAGDA
ncbi:MAG: UDP-2,3-diacylglucosamine diphosphatase LpxI, partial [Alphaproteobacteria bacterium]|nr:UDP-2,3-diacylglucosamine diphosphatase LpxI [Alphaproteobacteria bacterium]